MNFVYVAIGCLEEKNNIMVKWVKLPARESLITDEKLLNFIVFSLYCLSSSYVPIKERENLEEQSVKTQHA